MPSSSNKACAYCGKGKCDCKSQHIKEYNREFAKRYDYKWAKLSKAFLAANPLCEICLAKGKTTAAEHVHHTKGHEENMYEWSTLMALCVSCHNAVDR